MPSTVETSTPPNTPTPIGPYNHIAKVGPFITIGGTAGFHPATGRLAGPDVEAQTRRILESFRVMLASVNSDLDHVIHIVQARRRTRKAGNAYFFEPAVTRKSVYRRLVEELLDLVGGSQPLVAHLVETGKLSLDDLKAIESSAKAPKRGRK